MFGGSVLVKNFFFNILCAAEPHLIVWFLVCYLFYFFLGVNEVYTKLVLYIVCLSTLALISYNLKLDIPSIILFICELVIFIIFLALTLQTPLHKKIPIYTSGLHIWFFYLFFVGTDKFINFRWLHHNAIYSYCSGLNPIDFFSYYYYYFDVFSSVTVVLTILLFLFSFFFIILFQQLKLIKYRGGRQIKLVQLMRKQQFVHQSCFKPKIKVFSSINI